jgi:hypothetical protein
MSSAAAARSTSGSGRATSAAKRDRAVGTGRLTPPRPRTSAASRVPVRRQLPRHAVHVRRARRVRQVPLHRSHRPRAAGTPPSRGTPARPCPSAPAGSPCSAAIHLQVGIERCSIHDLPFANLLMPRLVKYAAGSYAGTGRRATRKGRRANADGAPDRSGAPSARERGVRSGRRRQAASRFLLVPAQVQRGGPAAAVAVQDHRVVVLRRRRHDATLLHVPGVEVADHLDLAGAALRARHVRTGPPGTTGPATALPLYRIPGRCPAS